MWIVIFLPSQVTILKSKDYTGQLTSNTKTYQSLTEALKAAEMYINELR